jgi:PDZ domain
MLLAAARRTQIAALAVCLCGGSIALAQEPELKQPAAQRPAPSAEQIASWIRELDADEFFTRETAMLQLLEAGPAVLPALKPVLTGGSLEATNRALYVVRQIGLTADVDTKDQSGQLLAELAARNEAPALARRAAAALTELTQQRSAQALADLETLGAKVIRNQVLGGIVLDEPALSIELGEAFKGDEQDLRRLKWVTDVPVLILCGKQVTDSWVKQAAAMPGLQELHLYQAQITDAGLAPVAERVAAGLDTTSKVPRGASLKQIGLYYTKVGDAVLKPLAELPLLGYVKLYGTRITKDGVKEFKNASGVSVDYRRGAFLGVGGTDLLDGKCRISTLHDDSPAAKAGLLRDDVIVRFGNEAVGNFSSLTELISQCDAGDEVEIEVSRPVLDDGAPPARNIIAKVKLAPWEVEPAVRNARR